MSGSRLWNSLPVNIRTAPNVHIFEKFFKTFLFPKLVVSNVAGLIVSLQGLSRRFSILLIFYILLECAVSCDFCVSAFCFLLQYIISIFIVKRIGLFWKCAI